MVQAGLALAHGSATACDMHGPVMLAEPCWPNKQPTPVMTQMSRQMGQWVADNMQIREFAPLLLRRVLLVSRQMMSWRPLWISRPLSFLHFTAGLTAAWVAVNGAHQGWQRHPARGQPVLHGSWLQHQSWVSLEAVHC